MSPRSTGASSRARRTPNTPGTPRCPTAPNPKSGSTTSAAPTAPPSTPKKSPSSNPSPARSNAQTRPLRQQRRDLSRRNSHLIPHGQHTKMQHLRHLLIPHPLLFHKRKDDAALRRQLLYRRPDLPDHIRRNTKRLGIIECQKDLRIGIIDAKHDLLVMTGKIVIGKIPRDGIKIDLEIVDLGEPPTDLPELDEDIGDDLFRCLP